MSGPDPEPLDEAEAELRGVGEVLELLDADRLDEAESHPLIAGPPTAE